MLKEKKASSEVSYEPFLSSVTRRQWEKFKLTRRAGVATPLFSIYSSKSIGLGELPDIKLLAAWCKQTQMSIIQLLPMNDVGFTFRPYDAQSGFALEPMYLSLHELRADVTSFAKKIENLRKQFPAGSKRVNYQVKRAKMELLWEIFQYEDKSKQSFAGSSFASFVRASQYWLDDFTVFKVIKENNNDAGWESWPDEFKRRDEAALRRIREEHAVRIRFHQWLQWQLFEQFSAAKRAAALEGIFLMGDLPFLVSRDSADVWAHQDYFKLDAVSGAPPDFYFANGQRWGMPPYAWQNIERDDFRYLISKLQYAEHFYDMYRIDHFIGIFRLWTIPINEPPESGGLNGAFDPADESLWEAQGRKILAAMIENTQMLPCAEDLGVVPKCSEKVLDEYAIPGMDVQRWVRDWGATYDFKLPEQYRKNSISVIATHDSSSLAGWWLHEAGTVDGLLFQRKCELHGISFVSVKERLFDERGSKYGRLRWKKEVANREMFCSILGRNENDIRDLTGLYLGTYDEKAKFCRYLNIGEAAAEKNFPAFARLVFEKVQATASIFSVQLLQDWLSLDAAVLREMDPWQFRINFPGTMNDENWTLVIPVSLEKLKKITINDKMAAINRQAKRQ